jgi:hypothetical protein
MDQGKGGAGGAPEHSQPVDLSIIVINWNTADYLAGCLDSLARSDLDGLTAEVWVTDNASTDGSADLVRSRYPWTRLEANPSNLGFAAANNAVMRKARGRVFFLLNADMVVPPDTTAKLFSRIASAPGIGAAACRQVDALGSTLESYMFDFMDGRIPGGVQPPSREPEAGQGVEVAWVWGSGVMVRREVFERIGGFDESFFMYCEDLEWCWRMRRAGWRIVCHPDLHVVHFVRRSTSRAPAAATARRLVEGEFTLYQRHLPPRRFRSFVIGRFFYSLRGIAFYRVMLALAPCERYQTKYLRYLASVKVIAARSPAWSQLMRRCRRLAGQLRGSPAGPGGAAG